MRAANGVAVAPRVRRTSAPNGGSALRCARTASKAASGSWPGASRTVMRAVVEGSRVFDARATVGTSMPVTVADGRAQTRAATDPEPVRCTPSGTPVWARNTSSGYSTAGSGAVTRPGTATEPSASQSRSSSRTSAVTASGAAPPYEPECRPWSRVRTCRSTTSRPRRLTVSEGRSSAQLVASATTTTSAASRSAWRSSRSANEGEPISSSPSTSTTRPTPSSGPHVGSSVRSATRWATTPPLSSPVPRPKSRPSRSVGSNGAVVQRFSSPGGCTSWWAYSSTVGRPGGAGRRPTTAGAPGPPSAVLPVSSCTSSSPAPSSRAATASAPACTCAWSKAAADTDGMRTRSSRSVLARAIWSRTAARASTLTRRRPPAATAAAPRPGTPSRTRRGAGSRRTRAPGCAGPRRR